MSFSSVSSTAPSISPSFKQSSEFKDIQEFVKKGDFKSIRALCEKSTPEERKSIFFQLCSWQTPSLELIIMILESIDIYMDFVDLKSVNGLGQTALHLSCLHENYFIAKYLLNYGADRSLKDRSGSTPLQLAEETGNSKLIKLLKKDDLIILNGFNIYEFLELIKKSEEATDKAALTEKTAILLGLTGKGKTTFVNWRFGCHYRTKRNGELELQKGIEKVKQKLRTASDTTFFKTYDNIMDAPGMHDTKKGIKGSIYDIHREIILGKLAENGMIKQLIIVLSAPSFKSTDRNEELRSVAEWLKEMVGDSSLILPHTYFVITMYDTEKFGPESVKDFFDEFVGKKLKEIQEEQAPENAEVEVLLKILMKSKNILLTDYTDSEKSVAQRKEFISNLSELPPIPPGILRHTMPEKQGDELKTIVNSFFELFTSSLTTRIINQYNINEKNSAIKSVLQAIEELEQNKKIAAGKIFEGGRLNKEDIERYEKEILQLRGDIGSLEVDIQVIADKITNITNHSNPHLQDSELQDASILLPDYTDKSLNNLIKVEGLLSAQVNSWNTDDVVEFVNETYKDERKRVKVPFWGECALPTWSSKTFSFEKPSRPYSDASVTPKKGYVKKGTEIKKPVEGLYKNYYTTSYGEDAEALFVVKGLKKIKYKDDIAGNQNKIKKITPVIDGYETASARYSSDISRKRASISSKEKDIQMKQGIIDALKRSDNITAQKELQSFLELKKQEIQKIEKAIEDENIKLKSLKTEKVALEKEEKIIKKRIKRIKKTHSEEDIKLMSHIVKITKIEAKAFEEYQKLPKKDV